MLRRVYYLDDEPALLELFTESYSGPETEVETFTDYEKLLRRTAEVPPDLIFLDYRLPYITGDDVAAQLPSGIPKVLITGEIRVNPRYPYLKVLGKPFDSKVIRALLEGADDDQASGKDPLPE